MQIRIHDNAKDILVKHLCRKGSALDDFEFETEMHVHHTDEKIYLNVSIKEYSDSGSGEKIRHIAEIAFNL